MLLSIPKSTKHLVTEEFLADNMCIDSRWSLRSTETRFYRVSSGIQGPITTVWLSRGETYGNLLSNPDVERTFRSQWR